MDYTPIDKLLPKKNHDIESADIVEKYSDNTDPIDNILDDIDNDKESDSIVDRFKGYIKLIVIIAVLYFIVSNQTSINLLKNYAGDNFATVCGSNTLVLTSTGLLVIGCVLGLLFVLIKMTLGYVAEI